MTKEAFGGNKKVGKSILWDAEQVFIRWAVEKVPLWIKSHHLTLASIPISLFIILFSYLAIENIQWLWGASAMIFMQWLTDSLDGAVGRARKEGLIKWGYYADHLLDYFFLAAIMIGYMLLLPDEYKYGQFFVFALFAGYMVNSFLSFAASNEFRIAHLGVGPTEIRILFILVNTFLIYFGKTYMYWSLPYVLGFSFLGLCIVAYRTGQHLWKLDMEAKKLNEN